MSAVGVQFVPQQYVLHVWPHAAELLKRGECAGTDDYTVEQLKVFVIRGEHVLMVIVDEKEEVVGALTFQWIDYPNSRVAFISAIGGNTELPAWEQFSGWLRQQGCTTIRGIAPKAVARLWRQKYGFSDHLTMVEKQL